jgi:hypothetical protein
MSTARCIHRSAVLCALACALLVSVMSGAAAARTNADTQASAALAQERYYSSYGEPETPDAGTSAALAQERYYSSYGEPEPLTLPQPSAPSDKTPWLPIALSVAIVMLIVAMSTTLLRRLRVRRRAARATA